MLASKLCGTIAVPQTTMCNMRQPKGQQQLQRNRPTAAAKWSDNSAKVKVKAKAKAKAKTKTLLNRN